MIVARSLAILNFGRHRRDVIGRKFANGNQVSKCTSRTIFSAVFCGAARRPNDGDCPLRDWSSSRRSCEDVELNVIDNVEKTDRLRLAEHVLVFNGAWCGSFN